MAAPLDFFGGIFRGASSASSESDIAACLGFCRGILEVWVPFRGSLFNLGRMLACELVVRGLAVTLARSKPTTHVID